MADLRRAGRTVVDRALRLGDAKDWAIVGAALCMLLAAILVTALWNAPVHRRSEAPMRVVTVTGQSEIMVAWTRS